MLELVGTFGVALLALCAMPQAIVSYMTGTSRGISAMFLSMWFFGELFTLIYVMGNETPDLLLAANYAANLLALCVVVWFYLFPRA